MPRYEGYLMNNKDVVVRKTGEGDASWIFKNVDDIDQYLGFVETDDYEQAEKMFSEKARL